MIQAPPTATTDPSPEACDVLVVGGGPGGSTLAALLARQGRSVVLLEKARHPRFHIGESLLPLNGPLFDALGVRAQVEAMAMPKWGVEFVSPQHEGASRLEFAQAWDKRLPKAWQVRRDAFDELLFRHAAAQGAQVLEGCRARRVDFDAEGATVQATLDDGAPRHWRARYVVDASGRDTLLAQQFGSKQRNPRHNSAAIFGHFSGAQRLPGRLEGNISVFWFEHGWFWFIPLADGSTSVGATCWPHYLKSRRVPLEDFFLQTIALCPPLAQRLQGAQLLGHKVWATGNYSYSAQSCVGERWAMVGDAYAFIDPVFSSGVYLAMAGAFQAAELVRTTLDHPQHAAAARRRYVAHTEKGPRVFSWFILRMTNPVLRGLFMRPRNVMRTQEAVLSMLAGDIFGRTPIWASLRFFKLVYYVQSLKDWRGTWAAWRARRHNIRDVGAVDGENVALGAR